MKHDIKLNSINKVTLHGFFAWMFYASTAVWALQNVGKLVIKCKDCKQIPTELISGYCWDCLPKPKQR